MIDGHVEGHGDRAVTRSAWVPKLHMLRCKGVGGDVSRGEDVEVGQSGRPGVTGKKLKIMVEVIWGMSGDTCREVRGGENSARK
jgi:hypothetical protein